MTAHDNENRGTTANPVNGSPADSPYFRLMVMGLEFSSPILGGLIGGYYIGDYFHRPWIGLVGLIGGVFLGFYRLILEIRRFMKSAQ
jgi:F0F1-type ATP synthase assembly protein I